MSFVGQHVVRGPRTIAAVLIAGLCAALIGVPGPGAQAKPANGSKAALAKAKPGKNKDVLSRKQVLTSGAQPLARIGRHVIIGYETISSVRALVEKRAIAGIFMTDHNVRRKSVAQVKAEIDGLQAIRTAQGLPPLIVAADQEGGAVSRLSPPLTPQPSIASILANTASEFDRQKAVEDYARIQAAELKRIGVNMNFAPVVDLNIDPKRRSDGETRLRLRAIASDPELVARVAGWYCDTLAESGVMCTMKHFPGLGHVGRDTHRVTGEITLPESQLKAADWVPFVRLMNRPNVATMLAHVRLTAIDKDTPASFSRRVIGGMMREDWAHQGILITDDLSMGAVTRSKDGVGGAAVKALNAGADLILISFSDKHLNAVMTSLLKAEADGKLDAQRGDESAKRLAKIPDRGTEHHKMP
jgi:beta-N-acetylhexosaminidase